MNEEFNYNHFLENLVNARKSLGLTQKQVEKSLGFRSLTLYDYESGRLKVPIEELVRLANLYKIKVEKLLGSDSVISEDETSGPFAHITSLTKLGLVGNGKRQEDLYHLILKDPLIQVELDMDELKHEESILSIFSEKLTDKQKRSFLVESTKYINSLIGIDKKISRVELDLRDMLIDNIEIKLSTAERNSINKSLNIEYFGSNIIHAFPRDSYRHLLIWILFLVSLADNYYHPKEAEYISKVAENIGLSKKHFLLIEKKILEKVDKYNYKG